MFDVDTNAAQSVVDNYVSDSGAINTYVRQVEAANFAPSYDNGFPVDIRPYPNIYNAIQIVKQNAARWRNIQANFGVAFTNHANIIGRLIQSVIDTLDGTAQTNTGQKTALENHLRTIADDLQQLKDGIQTQYNAVIQYSDSLKTDRDMFSSASTAIDEQIIAGINAKKRQERDKSVSQYGNGYGGMMFDASMGQIYDRQIDGYRNYQRTFTQLSQANEQASNVISGLLNFWQTLSDKTNSVQSDIIRAYDANPHRMRLDLQTAEKQWRELLDYYQKQTT